VYARRASEPAGAADLGALDAEAIARVRDEERLDARDADELHDALVTTGLIGDEELRRHAPMVQELMQTTLDKYGAGIQITQVQLQKVDPPAQVIDSFRDVQAARADLERSQNEAQTYANKVVPEARGRAAQTIQNAEAYREQTVAEAKGATSRFLKVYDEYKKAPEVTRQRMYLETMERLFGGTDKIIMDSGGGVVPYLPLDQLSRRPQPPAAPQTGAAR
jgi:membrane protease subunit HflK